MKIGGVSITNASISIPQNWPRRFLLFSFTLPFKVPIFSHRTYPRAFVLILIMIVSFDRIINKVLDENEHHGTETKNKFHIIVMAS